MTTKKPILYFQGPGDRVELVLETAPGRIFSGTVFSSGFAVQQPSSADIGEALITGIDGRGMREIAQSIHLEQNRVIRSLNNLKAAVRAFNDDPHISCGTCQAFSNRHGGKEQQGKSEQQAAHGRMPPFNRPASQLASWSVRKGRQGGMGVPGRP